MNAYDLAEIRRVLDRAGHRDWTVNPARHQRRDAFHLLDRQGHRIVSFARVRCNPPEWTATNIMDDQLQRQGGHLYKLTVHNPNSERPTPAAAVKVYLANARSRTQ